jgi:hypothetical protein
LSFGYSTISRLRVIVIGVSKGVARKCPTGEVETTKMVVVAKKTALNQNL